MERTISLPLQQALYHNWYGAFLIAFLLRKKVPKKDNIYYLLWFILLHISFILPSLPQVHCSPFALPRSLVHCMLLSCITPALTPLGSLISIQFYCIHTHTHTHTHTSGSIQINSQMVPQWSLNSD